MNRNIIRLYGILLVGLFAPNQLWAVVLPFTPGDILVTRNNIFSSGTDYLFEYTVGGVLVQTIPIDRPDGAQLTAGDIVYDSRGRIHLV